MAVFCGIQTPLSEELKVAVLLQPPAVLISKHNPKPLQSSKFIEVQQLTGLANQRMLQTTSSEEALKPEALKAQLK